VRPGKDHARQTVATRRRGRRCTRARAGRRHARREVAPARPHPTGLRVTAVTHDSVTLAWNPSTDNVGVRSNSLWGECLSGVRSVTAPQRSTAPATARRSSPP
jgi:hypothetical protein